MTGGTAVEALARGRTVIVGAWVVVGVCTFGLLATVLYPIKLDEVVGNV